MAKACVYHRVATGNKKPYFFTVIAQVSTSEIWGRKALYHNDHPVDRVEQLVGNALRVDVGKVLPAISLLPSADAGALSLYIAERWKKMPGLVRQAL